MYELNKCLAVLKTHDYSTYLHSRRVASLAILLGEKVGLVSKEIEQLMITALLHDIGKVNIPTGILNKSGILSASERNEIINHPKYGAEMIKGVNCFSQNIVNGIKFHHEFYNGNGYPQGLKGESIPVFARIIAIADAFDAMTNSRPYRSRPLLLDEAWGEIEVHAGTQFDPYIVKSIMRHSLKGTIN